VAGMVKSEAAESVRAEQPAPCNPLQRLWKSVENTYVGCTYMIANRFENIGEACAQERICSAQERASQFNHASRAILGLPLRRSHHSSNRHQQGPVRQSVQQVLWSEHSDMQVSPQQPRMCA
jgi:hypothetical protein